MSQTRIFVSSTCYDLMHMRQSLRQHILDLGHFPVMSEFSSFRVDPSQSSLANCIANVRENADLFVLLIGGRRGTLDATVGKSVVNLEYEAAVREGLDILVFVDSSVLTLLPIWKNNKEIPLSPIVDSNYVIEFVDRIRDEQRWTFSFNSAKDIRDVLADQLSAQLRDLLAKRRSGHLTDLDRFKNENPFVLELVRDQPPFWEYLLTAELFDSRLQVLKRRYEDILSGRVLGPHTRLAGRDFLTWINAKFAEVTCIVKKMKFTLERDVQAAWGAPGVSGKPHEILAAIEQLNFSLNALAEVESSIYRTRGPDASEPVRECLLGMTEEILATIEDMPKRLRDGIRQAENRNENDGPLTLALDFVFTFERGAHFAKALDEMQARIIPDEWNSIS